MKVKVDTEGVTTGCPNRWLNTREDCLNCEYFIEFDGFDVVCSYVEPEQEEE